MIEEDFIHLNEYIFKWCYWYYSDLMNLIWLI